MTAGFQPSAGSGTDPRSIVTPDAFVVSDGLLGMPLAPPGRRLAAILVDLVVIGIVTALTKSFALVLGVVASVLFIRAGFKRVSVPGSAFGRAMRASVGCLGVMVGFVTLILWSTFGVDLGGPEDPGRFAEGGTTVVRPDLATSVLAATSGIAFARATDLEGARSAGARIVAVGRDLGLADDEIAEVLRELVPQAAAWAPEADALITSLLAGGAGPADTLAVVEADTPSSGGADTLRTGAPDTSDVGADSLLPPDSTQLLAAQVEALADELRQAREDAERADAGLLTRLRGFLDELGFGFGWASLYLTVMLTWWKGQTVGKRMLGIRVVRLDGEPITWWTAFERAGGYAAGFATGLLGFAQVYWDANRQAIHDRIVGTVVVREGASRVTDWESAL